MEADVSRRKRFLGFALILGLLVLGVVHHEAFVTIVAKWGSDAAYSHGYLIPPIVLWLVWRKRGELRLIDWQPTWAGVFAITVCSMVWLVAHGSGVLVLEQFAVMAMIPTLSLTVLGWRATRCLLFPLGFLLLAVPFGRGMVPWLMQLTADLSTLALQWSGVPVWRSHMYISIPGGNFEVAKACSGLKFFVAGLVLGVLYAHLTYRTLRKRLLCVAAFVVIPILLNSARVYITILVSHLTDMRFGPGREHIAFGMAFFIVVTLVMFWIGRRWQDDFPAERLATDVEDRAGPKRPVKDLLIVVGAIAVVVLGPVLLDSSVSKARVALSDAHLLVELPKSVEGWEGPSTSTESWRPGYRGSIAEAQAVYFGRKSDAVEVFVAVYGLGNTIGTEMISYHNVIDAREFDSLAPETVRVLRIDDSRALKVRERVVDNGGDSRLVWYWYVIGDRAVSNQFAAKAIEAAAFVTRGAVSERVVVLSTTEDSGARQRLQAFVAAYGECVQKGFSVEACSG
jgi:exosortase A